MGRSAVSDLSKVIIDEELRDLLPPLTPDEFEKLEKNILKIGILDPFKVWSNDRTGEIYLIDGHNRYNICIKHNIIIGHWQIQYFDSNDFKTKKDVIKWILENQLGRRNLTVPERYEILQKHKLLFEVKAKENKSINGGNKKSQSTTLTTPIEKVNTRKEMAKLVGTSEGTYSKLDKIFSSDNDELIKKVKSGKVSVNKAFEEIKPQQEKPSHNINIEEGLNKLNADLKGMINNLSDTDDCDDLLSKIEEHNKKINSIKTEIFLARKQKYNQMADFELSCEVEIKGVKGDYNHRAFFYIVKTDGNTKNNKSVFDISVSGLKNTEHLTKMTEDLIKILPDNEYKLLMMKVWELNKKAIEDAEVEKRKQEIEWEKIMEDARKIDEYISHRPSLKCDNSTKEMLRDIVNQGYKQLAKKYHPDVSKDDGNQMMVLNNARDILGMIVGNK